ncbi:MAG: hypothetical protein PHQ54_04200 [Candidatus Omnitrophica bacterium]|nr:hypothetical protein [Candidatus Omnitrophota bacterium]
MINYFQRYIIRPLFAVLGLVIIAFFLANAAINIYLSLRQNDIEKIITNYIKEPVSFSSVFYLPPATVTFSDVHFKDSAYSPRLEYAEQIAVSFSLKDIMTTGRLSISRVHLKKPKIYCNQTAKFDRHKLEELKSAIIFLAKKYPLLLKITDAQITLYSGSGRYRNFTVSNTFSSKGLSLISQGELKYFCLDSVNDPRSIHPLRYELEIFANQNGYSIEKMDIDRGDSSLRLSGIIEGQTLKLKGYCSTGGLRKNYLNYQNTVSKIKKILFGTKPYIHILGPSKSRLDISDIDAVINFSLPVVQIERLGFNLNGIPSLISGNFLAQKNISFNLNYRNYPNQAQSDRSTNAKALDIALSFAEGGQGLNGYCNTVFYNNSGDLSRREELLLKFKNLDFASSVKNRTVLNSKNLDILYKSNSDYRIELKDFSIILAKNPESPVSFSVKSQLYNGTLDGNGFIAIGGFPVNLAVKFIVNGSESNSLDFLFFPHIYGKTQAEIDYVSQPEYKFNIRLVVEKGYTENLDFFGWLSDFLATPSIKDVNFRFISSYISGDKYRTNFEDISLDSDNIKIRGYLSIDSDNIISSKISLSLSKSVVAESVKLRPLMKILENELDYLVFDFQLSGFKNAVNFKWLESDFKDRLRRSIPGFIERGLERRVEDILRTFSATTEESL